MADDANQPLPGLPLLVAERPAHVGEDEELRGRPRCRKVPRRISQRPDTPGKDASAIRGASPTRNAARSRGSAAPAEEPLGRRAEEALARPVHELQLVDSSKAKTATSISSMTLRRRALASSAPSR